MSLFLKQSKFKSGKIYLSIVDGYWKDGKVKQKVYQKLGYLEDLKKLFIRIRFATLRFTIVLLQIICIYI